MTRYYLGVKVTTCSVARNGWQWAEWPDGRKFKFWADQLKKTPWEGTR